MYMLICGIEILNIISSLFVSLLRRRKQVNVTRCAATLQDNTITDTAFHYYLQIASFI